MRSTGRYPHTRRGQNGRNASADARQNHGHENRRCSGARGQPRLHGNGRGLLDGSTESKLSAAKAASFGQVELWRQDVEAAGGDTQAIVATLKRLGLGLTDYQVLLDFDGAPDAIRDAKRAEALRMLRLTVLCPIVIPRPACIVNRLELASVESPNEQSRFDTSCALAV